MSRKFFPSRKKINNRLGGMKGEMLKFRKKVLSKIYIPMPLTQLLALDK